MKGDEEQVIRDVAYGGTYNVTPDTVVLVGYIKALLRELDTVRLALLDAKKGDKVISDKWPHRDE